MKVINKIKAVLKTGTVGEEKKESKFDRNGIYNLEPQTITNMLVMKLPSFNVIQDKGAEELSEVLSEEILGDLKVFYQKTLENPVEFDKLRKHIKNYLSNLDIEQTRQRVGLKAVDFDSYTKCVNVQSLNQKPKKEKSKNQTLSN